MLGRVPAAGIVRSRDDDAAGRINADNRRPTVRGGSVNGVGIGYAGVPASVTNAITARWALAETSLVPSIANVRQACAADVITRLSLHSALRSAGAVHQSWLPMEQVSKGCVARTATNR